MDPTISLCMIVKDEEKLLERCLRSVKGQVDEIIIVDTGSQDRTVEIAEQFGAVIKRYPWNGDFSAARNYSIQDAQSDYILMLDADEYLHETSNLKADIRNQMDFYIYRIKNYGEHGNSYFHEAIRLFRNKVGIEYFGKIHEHLNVHGRGFTSGKGKSHIEHVGYAKEVVLAKNKVERNLKLLLEEVAVRPSGYNYYNLGKQYKSMEEYEKSLEVLKKAYYDSKDKTYLNELLYHMADVLRLLKRYQDGLVLLQDAINLFPNYTDLFYVKGLIYTEMDYFNEALDCFNTCISLGEVKDTGTREGVGSFISYYQTAILHEKMGNRLQSFEQIYKSLVLNSTYIPALRFYLELMGKANIPKKDVLQQLDVLFSPYSVEDAKNLINTMYVLRHPLLLSFINHVNINIQQLPKNVQGVAFLYGGEYLKAQSIWNELGASGENNRDIYLLSFIFGKTEILNFVDLQSDFNQKEIKVLHQIVEKNSNIQIKALSQHLQTLLISCVPRLIQLEEFDSLEYLVHILDIFGSKSSYYAIALKLKDYGLYDVSLAMFVDLYNSGFKKNEIAEIIGDIYLRNDLKLEALEYYENIIASSGTEYRIYRKVHDILDLLHQTELLDQMKDEIQKKFALAAL